MLIKVFLFFSIIFSSFTLGKSLYDFESVEDEKKILFINKRN